MYLVLRTNNETRIKAAVIFAERLFEGESLVVHEKEPGAELRIILRPSKDIAATLSIKALAGGRITPAYHVFELTFQLPKFAMCAGQFSTRLCFENAMEMVSTIPPGMSRWRAAHTWLLQRVLVSQSANERSAGSRS